MSGRTQPGRGAWGGALAVAALAAVADQATKAIARGSIAPGERIDLVAGVELVRVTNEGIAFGLLEGGGIAVLVAAAVAFAALLGFFVVSGDHPGVWLPVGLIAGGAIGNLIDRVRDGHVTDFIDPPAWPAFNLADVAITVGVAVLLIMLIRAPEPGAEPAQPPR